MCRHTNLKFSIIENMLTQKLKFWVDSFTRNEKKKNLPNEILCEA